MDCDETLCRKVEIRYDMELAVPSKTGQHRIGSARLPAYLRFGEPCPRLLRAAGFMYSRARVQTSRLTSKTAR
jgi:hypothetical protein